MKMKAYFFVAKTHTNSLDGFVVAAVRNVLYYIINERGTACLHESKNVNYLLFVEHSVIQ